MKEPVSQAPEPKRRGRPTAPEHLQRIDVPLRLPRWLASWIDSQEAARAEVIESALMKAYRLKAPAATSKPDP